MKPYEFLAEFYDKLNKDCDYCKWSQYLLKLLKDRGIVSGRGLDLGCGSGILTIELAKCGYDMTGIDLSEQMLSEAFARKSYGAKFGIGDMRSFRSPHACDFVNATCDAVNYLTEDGLASFLKCSYDNLKSGGMLLFDISSRYKLETILGNNIFADDSDEVTYIWQNDLNENAKELEMNFILFTKKGSAYYKKYEQHKMYLYGVSEVEQRLRAVGFEPSGVYAAFTLQPPKPETQRIQFTAVKP